MLCQKNHLTDHFLKLLKMFKFNFGIPTLFTLLGGFLLIYYFLVGFE